MSTLRRASVTGGPPAKDLFGRLREAQIVKSKPGLPAEILSIILDHLTVSDLMNFARTSKRMREMVYDDTRWVQRLLLMGCWNEAEARVNLEESRRKKLADINAKNEGQLKEGGTTGTERQKSNRIVPPQDQEQSHNAPQSLEDGFDFITLSPTSPEPTHIYLPLDANNLLDVLTKARSIRGAARQEYGRIYGALGPFYKDAIKSKHPSNAKIFRVYRNPIQQAQMLAQLVRFAKSDLPHGWQQRETKLTHMVTAFEDAVSREFQQGLYLKDVDGRMKKYAHVMVTLNGGQRAIEQFIFSNPVIMEKARLGDPLDCISPSNPDHIFLEESHAFFIQTSAAFNAQVGIIDRVFPPTVNVIVPFVQTVGKVVLTTYLETLITSIFGRSTESYVRIVSGTYEQSLRLAKSLQPTQNSGDEFYEAVDSMISNIFMTHIESYLSAELAFFKQKSEIEVNTWERQLSQQDASLQSMYMTNVNRQADKRDFLTSFKKVVMMPVNVLPTFPMSSRFSSRPTQPRHRLTGDSSDSFGRTPSPASSRVATPNPGGPMMISRTSTPQPEPPTTELAANAAIMKSRLDGIRSLFSLEVALNLVHMAKGGIERAAIFARVKGNFDSSARRQCETIFIVLVKTLGDRHVRAGFDQAVEHLSKYNPRAGSNQSESGVAPLIMFLELVNVGDLIQQMLDVFFEQELVATKLTDRNDFLNPAAKEKKRFEQMLDERVAAGLNKGIEVLMVEIEYIYATTQNIEDYNPGATGVTINKIIDITPSNTALWVVNMVSAHNKMLVGSTDKNMLDVFNQEVGLRLFTALCKHLKRQRISVSGSIRLISDMNHYFALVQTFKNRDLLQYFKALRELSQIYLISPDDAKELAAIIADTDRFLGIFRAEEVYEFAERRADWFQIKSRVEKAMYGFGCSIM